MPKRVRAFHYDAVRQELSRLESSRLPREFYARPVLGVARDLLGKLLVHPSRDGLAVGRIVEAEAYRGPEDRAAHSFGGRRTARNEAMWGPAGHAYVFFVYGMHWQFNVVTGREGVPHAVLIRAVEPVFGADLMAQRRRMPADRVELTNGPGKLCQALAIDRRHGGIDLCGPLLFLADAPKLRALRTPRVGIDYAGTWAERPWRFVVPGNPYVSRAPGATLRRK
jgi:DNA-3-methyladenine glycosylase